MRAVRRGAGAGADRHRRQLLRAGRRQHHVDPAGEPGAGGRALDHARGRCSSIRRWRRWRRLRARWPSRRPPRCRILRSARCRRRRSCAGCWSVAGRSIASTRRCCCRCRRGCGRIISIGALQTLLDHHDALRLRLTTAAQGEDSALEIAPPGTVDATACLRRVDISRSRRRGAARADRRAAQAAELRLAPRAGVMVQAVWLDAGEHAPGRLLLVIHHLAVDGVSWRILVPDLAAAWEAIARGDDAGAAGARDLVAALGAAACGRGARSSAAGRAGVLARDAGRAVTAAHRWLRSIRRATSAAAPGT